MAKRSKGIQQKEDCQLCINHKKETHFKFTSLVDLWQNDGCNGSAGVAARITRALYVYH